MPATPFIPSRAPPVDAPNSVRSLEGYFGSSPIVTHSRQHGSRHSYQVINNLLRVIRKGPAVKDAVDEAVDVCGVVENLRDSIEDVRLEAEQATNDWQKREMAQKGMLEHRFC